MRISDWSSDVCSSDLASLIHHAQPIAWWEVVALAFSLGIVNGLALNTGHELGHKKEPFDRWMAKIVLAVVGFGHFFIEHNKGPDRKRVGLGKGVSVRVALGGRPLLYNKKKTNK